jgi:RNA polymerase sigma-70 factor (sigma-E family)
MTGYADFEAFVDARRDALLRTAYLLTGDHHDAEDLVQTTLIKVVPKWGRINHRPEAYVRQVLARESVSRWRSRRWREVSTDELPDGMHDGQPDTADRIALLEDLRKLSPRQRAVLVLRYFDASPRPTPPQRSASRWERSSHTRATRWHTSATSRRARSRPRPRHEATARARSYRAHARRRERSLRRAREDAPASGAPPSYPIDVGVWSACGCSTGLRASRSRRTASTRTQPSQLTSATRSTTPSQGVA